MMTVSELIEILNDYPQDFTMQIGRTPGIRDSKIDPTFYYMTVDIYWRHINQFDDLLADLLSEEYGDDGFDGESQ